MNYKHLTIEQHRGNLGPHLNKATDLKYKKELETKLRELLIEKHYTVEELIEILGLKSRQAYKAFRQTRKTSRGIVREDAIYRLLGEMYYL